MLIRRIRPTAFQVEANETAKLYSRWTSNFFSARMSRALRGWVWFRDIAELFRLESTYIDSLLASAKMPRNSRRVAYN